MKQLLLTNWHAMRWIRLAIGLFFNTASDTIPTDIIRFHGCFFSIDLIPDAA
jgi:hypothetical protein